MVLPRLLKLFIASMWLGSSFAQKVTQAQPAMWVQEKEDVSLLCSYDTSDARYSLLWYKQPSSGEMVFLICQNSYSQQNATEGCYSVNLQKMNASPGLVTVMLLIFGRTHGQSVTQTEGQLTMSEGSILTINCTYSATGYANLFWYVQYPGEGPQLLLKAMKVNDKGSEKGFEATYRKETTSFHLEKASVQESDSAVYYCALGDTVAETAGGAEHKL
ncbi:hypothetical protein GHT09_012165 [Marmota monax]|uniref:Ig-like domain-containing protein n=1 Tax=Marmota monax TaxID=9995 RepID=A0A834QCC4_MARMO|nr:hypothetical protein GHT09_012165 [Marmota monax]